MDSKKSPNRRSRRQSKPGEENYWDCSVCTYRNSAESFKCLMCDVRKGTSTRKPRLNPQLVSQQVVHHYAPPQTKQKISSKLEKKNLENSSAETLPKKRHRPRLKNVDRSSGQQKAVTVNNVTVIITEFQPKSSDRNGRLSSGNTSDSGSMSDSTNHSDVKIGSLHSDR
ncbi:YY1-associated factor 2-like isoform X2 [Limulus polyphemus]|uniref:YY1-associated factor 2-like isoform X2 n=1 Tax=Limulus polyphemus TaxID=6850 RepID=A0ABM1C0C8_LIMPO|nr:YY1-associated factor 2-like isoform X2 [Limulus polyphemus]